MIYSIFIFLLPEGRGDEACEPSNNFLPFPPSYTKCLLLNRPSSLPSFSLTFVCSVKCNYWSKLKYICTIGSNRCEGNWKATVLMQLFLKFLNCYSQLNVTELLVPCVLCLYWTLAMCNFRVHWKDFMNILMYLQSRWISHKILCLLKYCHILKKKINKTETDLHDKVIVRVVRLLLHVQIFAATTQLQFVQNSETRNKFCMNFPAIKFTSTLLNILNSSTFFCTEVSRYDIFRVEFSSVSFVYQQIIHRFYLTDISKLI